MKKISKEIFTPYLYEEDSIRPALEKPFLCKGYVCATDARILLMIREDLLEDKFGAVKNTPDASKVVPPHNCNLILKRNALAQTISCLPMKDELEEVSPEIPCEECNGDGQVEWKYEGKNYHDHSHWFDCPCCDGTGVSREAVFEPTGRKIPDDNALVILNGVGIWAIHLQMLLDTMDFLGAKEATVRALNSEAPCRFEIAEGIDFIVIPICNFSLATATHHLNINPQS